MFTLFMGGSLMLGLALLCYIQAINWGPSGKHSASTFECGLKDSCTSFLFSMRFFMVLLIFMLFDIELMIFFPLFFVLSFNKWLTFFFVLPFLGLMYLILWYEWSVSGIFWE